MISTATPRAGQWHANEYSENAHREYAGDDRNFHERSSSRLAGVGAYAVRIAQEQPEVRRVNAVLTGEKRDRD